MDDLIKRAFEVRDALRYCVAADGVFACRQCNYDKNGCYYAIMLDAAKVIERMIEEVDGGEQE